MAHAQGAAPVHHGGPENCDRTHALFNDSTVHGIPHSHRAILTVEVAGEQFLSMGEQTASLQCITSRAGVCHVIAEAAGDSSDVLRMHVSMHRC